MCFDADSEPAIEPKAGAAMAHRQQVEFADASAQAWAEVRRFVSISD